MISQNHDFLLQFLIWLHIYESYHRKAVSYIFRAWRKVLALFLQLSYQAVPQ